MRGTSKSIVAMRLSRQREDEQQRQDCQHLRQERRNQVTVPVSAEAHIRAAVDAEWQKARAIESGPSVNADRSSRRSDQSIEPHPSATHAQRCRLSISTSIRTASSRSVANGDAVVARVQTIAAQETE